MDPTQLEQDPRLVELNSNLKAVRERMAAAAKAGGRNPEGVALTVVTKTYPAADVYRLHQLGVRDFAENRDQEAAPKARELAELLASQPAATELAEGIVPGSPRWHFVGQAQTNKTNSIVRYAQIVESVDRPKLARALNKSAINQEAEVLTCLIQVNLDPEAPADRGGAQPNLIPEIAEVIAGADLLNLGGVMAVAPLGQDPRKAFENLAEIHQNLLREYPEAGMMSAGMSSDFELAIQLGATHVRLGAAVLGQRESLR